MAESNLRKRSPRAPSLTLKDGVERAGKVYEKENRHPTSVNIVAQHIGYKSAESGAARQTLAGLGYYGLLERQPDGRLAVSKSFEEYKFAPTEELRAEILANWLRTPPLFAELLEKYQDKLPSDASLKYELIQKGFNPPTAGECLGIFRDSVDYVKSVAPNVVVGEEVASKLGSEVTSVESTGAKDEQAQAFVADFANRHRDSLEGLAGRGMNVVNEQSSDKIPVRLANGRKAWLVIPSPFYAADKQRLISQIELLLADDEE